MASHSQDIYVHQSQELANGQLVVHKILFEHFLGDKVVCGGLCIFQQ